MYLKKNMNNTVIKDILSCHIVPFEISDEKVTLLFSYFLHLAPTINSNSAKQMSESSYDLVWKQFLQDSKLDKKDYYIYAPGYIKNKQLASYRLTETEVVRRNRKGFVCCYKENESYPIECVLRHIRNSIAHSNVYMLDKGRKYIIFDDYNKKGHMSARFLLSQTDLSILKKLLKSKEVTEWQADFIYDRV